MVRISDDFALQATEPILGFGAGEVQMNGYEIVKDLIGEVTNVTVGGFKKTLCDIGFPGMLTLPTIVRGNNLEVATLKSAIRYTFHFECAGHRLIADIQLKHD